MNEKAQSILDELTQLNIGDLEDVLLGLLTHVDDAFVTNFNADDFCAHLRSAVVVLQCPSGN